MKCFKIESIEYGWFEWKIYNEYIETSSWLGFDSSKDFLEKLVKLFNGSSKEYVYITNEPGASIIEITQVQENFIINWFSLNKNSYELSPKIEDEIKNIEECYFSISINKKELLNSVVTEYSLYETGNGRCCYESNWNKFPKNEYNKLKEIAFKLNDLPCTDFLKI